MLSQDIQSLIQVLGWSLMEGDWQEMRNVSRLDPQILIAKWCHTLSNLSALIAVADDSKTGVFCLIKLSVYGIIQRWTRSIKYIYVYIYIYYIIYIHIYIYIYVCVCVCVWKHRWNESDNVKPKFHEEKLCRCQLIINDL